MNNEITGLDSSGKLLEEDLKDLYTLESNMLEVCANENLHVESVVSKIYLENQARVAYAQTTAN